MRLGWSPTNVREDRRADDRWSIGHRNLRRLILGSQSVMNRQFRLPPALILLAVLGTGSAGSALFFESSDESDQPFTTAGLMPAAVGNPDSVPTPDETARNKDEALIETSDPVAVVAEQVKQSPEDLVANRRSSLIVGSWTQEKFGTRTLIVHEDGTAEMAIVPNGAWSLVFGTRIDLTMFWSVKDGKLDYGVSGGTPEDKVRMAAKTWGDHWVEEIVELSEEKLDLLAEDGKSHSIWTRVTPSDESVAE